jgi:N-methylhydantoinase B/oxoprolinase/acetone carboxylase alpha subunit
MGCLIIFQGSGGEGVFRGGEGIVREVIQI